LGKGKEKGRAGEISRRKDERLRSLTWIALAALTTGMATAFTAGVTLGTGGATVIETLFFDGIGDRYYAYTRLASTFHGGYSGHGGFL
jgi:hypothetical protein